MEQQQIKNFESSNGVETSLNEKQRELVENMRRFAFQTADDGRPLAGTAELYLSDRFRKIFELRNKLSQIWGTGDVDRAKEITDEIEAILRDLKRAGVPYHPALGNKEDWERLEVKG